MTMSRSKLQSLLPILIGSGLTALFFLGIAYFREGGPRDSNSNDRAGILQLITQIRINIASASEAETSAVVAQADQASAGFAEQARAATASAERARSALAPLISRSGTDNERDLFARFSQAFTEFQQVQATLLDLAVKNTNVKAYGLAFGPAAEALHHLDDALDRLVGAHEGTPDAVAVSTTAGRVQIGALRIQILLAPHIAEADDKKMDQLEATMSAEDKVVRDNLDRLARMDQARTEPSWMPPRPPTRISPLSGKTFWPFRGKTPTSAHWPFPSTRSKKRRRYVKLLWMPCNKSCSSRS